MCSRLNSLLSLIVSICTLYYVVHISLDTKIDTFQHPLEQEDKKNLFFSPNSNPVINSLDYDLKCKLYEDSIMNPKVKKLGDLFNINIGLIHDQVTSLIIIYIVIIILIVLILFISILLSNTKNFLFVCLFCGALIATGGLIITNILLIFRIFGTFYKSDIFNFVQFLSCKNVNRQAFGKHLYVEDLQYHFIRFVFFGILSLLFTSGSNSRNNENNNRQQENADDIELTNTE